MTTVAFDGKSLAADRLVGENLDLGKIFKLEDGFYFSGCGYYEHLIEAVSYLNRAPKDKDLQVPFPWNSDIDSQFIIVNPDTLDIYWLTWPNLLPVKYNEKLVAIGSGADYALGAMHQGATAKQAVEIAKRLDKSTGGNIDEITFTVKKPSRKKGASTRRGK